MSDLPLRVCIDARVRGGLGGGVEQVTAGLAAGLSGLQDGDEEYVFLAIPSWDEWIAPHVRGPCRLLFTEHREGLKERAKRIPGARLLWHYASPLGGARTVSVERSDGTIERAGMDVMHFPFQPGFLTDVPSIYQPWDLQHMHLPQFFTPRERLGRDVIFRALCEQASMVVTATAWVKRDLHLRLGVPTEKIFVVPAAPVLTIYPTPSDDELAAIRCRFALPEAFLYYPSATWPHKNHLGLLEALALLRDRYDLSLPLVCSGRKSDFFPRIERAVGDLRMGGLVQFLGFLEPVEVQALYQLCRAVVFPTRFEGWGMPLMEAFVAGAPAACSNATCLPELAGDAALLFDPDRPDEIAATIQQLWKDDELRRALASRGRARATSFTFDRMARTFRAHYRRIGGRRLTDEDERLIAESRAT